MVFLDIKKVSDGSIIHIDAEVSDTIGLIKAKTHDAGLPTYDKQRFIYNGKELENIKTLADYGILDNNDTWTIHVVLKEEENFIVKINKPDGNTIDIKYDNVFNDETVQLLKQKIFILTGLKPNKYDLYLADKLLEVNTQLKYYLIRSNIFDIKMR